MKIKPTSKINLGNNIKTIVQEKQIRKDIPAFKAGDTVKVYVKIKEGNKERIQPYEGLVISRRGVGTSASFTVRKISSQIGVERVFMVSSPLVQKVEVIKRGKVCRAKLYYMRNRSGKSARIKEIR